MFYYIEITIIPNEEIPTYDIWPRLYTQLHLALVETKDIRNQVSVGISFPQYKADKTGGKVMYCLGSKLRVIANSLDELQQLNLDKWLARLTDYVHVKSPKQVEGVTQYLTVNRYRPKPNVEKVAKRFAKHKSIPFEEALQHCQQHKKGWQDFPYVQMKSLSTKTEEGGGREFSLCINQSVAEKANQGKFSCYGLSATSTVPHW